MIYECSFFNFLQIIPKSDVAITAADALELEMGAHLSLSYPLLLLTSVVVMFTYWSVLDFDTSIAFCLYPVLFANNGSAIITPSQCNNYVAWKIYNQISDVDLFLFSCFEM